MKHMLFTYAYICNTSELQRGLLHDAILSHVRCLKPCSLVKAWDLFPLKVNSVEYAFEDIPLVTRDREGIPLYIYFRTSNPNPRVSRAPYQYLQHALIASGQARLWPLVLPLPLQRECMFFPLLVGAFFFSLVFLYLCGEAKNDYNNFDWWVPPRSPLSLFGQVSWVAGKWWAPSHAASAMSQRFGSLSSWLQHPNWVVNDFRGAEALPFAWLQFLPVSGNLEERRESSQKLWVD